MKDKNIKVRISSGDKKTIILYDSECLLGKYALVSLSCDIKGTHIKINILNKLDAEKFKSNDRNLLIYKIMSKGKGKNAYICFSKDIDWVVDTVFVDAVLYGTDFSIIKIPMKNIEMTDMADDEMLRIKNEKKEELLKSNELIITKMQVTLKPMHLIKGGKQDSIVRATVSFKSSKDGLLESKYMFMESNENELKVFYFDSRKEALSHCPSSTKVFKLNCNKGNSYNHLTVFTGAVNEGEISSSYGLKFWIYGKCASNIVMDGFLDSLKQTITIKGTSLNPFKSFTELREFIPAGIGLNEFGRPRKGLNIRRHKNEKLNDKFKHLLPTNMFFIPVDLDGFEIVRSMVSDELSTNYIINLLRSGCLASNGKDIYNISSLNVKELKGNSHDN